jgi:hypothetical protein
MSEQLELFQVLNQKQQQEVNDWVKRENQRIIERVESLKRIIDLLEEGGFEEDVHFKRDFEIGTNTFERKFGWDVSFKADVTVNTIKGGVYLIHKSFYNNQLITRKSNVSREGDKLMCNTITPQWRYYLPSSLLDKLNEHNRIQEQKNESYIKNNKILNYTINKYAKLFPDAEVKCVSSRYSRKNVLVEFKSGSWVEFSLGYQKDNEVLSKKFDAKVDQLKAMDLLNHFSNQLS